MINWKISKLEETASTNDEAQRAAERGAEEGLVIWALRQTAGRGRQGRLWESPDGNLACSIVLRPLSAQETYGEYSFVSALAAHDCVSGLLPPERGPQIALKWPNDVLVGGKKICGILLETGPGWIVAGIGINVASHPSGSTYPATCLLAEGMPARPLETVLDLLLSCVGRWADIRANKGFAPLREAWLERATRGNMTVKLGGETVKGEFVDIDERGALRLKLENGKQRVLSAGDVFL